jgi:hypothetical protein
MRLHPSCSTRYYIRLQPSGLTIAAPECIQAFSLLHQNVSMSSRLNCTRMHSRRLTIAAEDCNQAVPPLLHQNASKPSLLHKNASKTSHCHCTRKHPSSLTIIAEECI